MLLIIGFLTHIKEILLYQKVCVLSCFSKNGDCFDPPFIFTCLAALVVSTVLCNCWLELEPVTYVLVWAYKVFHFCQRIVTYKSNSLLMFSVLVNIIVISLLCYFCSLDVTWTEKFCRWVQWCWVREESDTYWGFECGCVDEGGSRSENGRHTGQRVLSKYLPPSETGWVVCWTWELGLQWVWEDPVWSEVAQEALFQVIPG